MTDEHTVTVKTTWNPSLESILKKEAEHAEGLYWLHARAAVIVGRKNDYLMIPSIILSAVNGFMIGTNDPQVPPLALGLVSILVGILTTISTYFKWAQKSESHKIASLLYLKLYKTVEIELAKPVNQRIDADELLKSLKEQMFRVVETAPPLGERVIREFKQKFRDETTVSRPLVANGLSEVRIYSQETKPNQIEV